MKSSQKIAIARRSLAALAHVCRAMCACCGWLMRLANAPGPAKLDATGGSLRPPRAENAANFFRWTANAPFDQGAGGDLRRSRGDAARVALVGLGCAFPPALRTRSRSRLAPR